MTFSERLTRLDRRVFSTFSDGDVIIDGKSIAAIFDKQSVQFSDSRGTERMLSISQLIAKELGINPNTNSKLVWQGQLVRLAIPPIYEDGLIKLVLV
ncbi:hypothetical protein ABMX64_19905 [Vibrio vulnificus]|uniref:hypothetical protein n=1 Tax=Vibrio vulnificus TaxID=672 RepID=UPI0024DFC2C5|nr:hypothetical protein [Vibrio vulnificus]MDK2679282.1 hypothetical protein [Vibrio vulnificus]MDK2688042.1 hypothetical protein [Vibrio vulnificus]